MRDRIPAGVVMTGGGALLPGTIQMAESIFKCPVRLGTPRNFDGNGSNGTKLRSPAYATCLGLVKYGLRLHEAGKKGGMDEPGKLASLYNSTKDWFLDHF
jgi:cell division protein FtsA